MQASRSSDMTILFMPVYDAAHPMMGGMGNNYSDLRWYGSPDSHPAVQPRSMAQPVKPSSAGAQVDTLPPEGASGGAATSQDGRLAGTCQPAPNAGVL